MIRQPGKFDPRYPGGNGPIAPWLPPNMDPNVLGGKGCEPYYIVDGGLIPLVGVDEEKAPNCMKQLTCYYSGSIFEKMERRPGRQVHGFEHRVTISKKIPDKDCCTK